MAKLSGPLILTDAGTDSRKASPSCGGAAPTTGPGAGVWAATWVRAGAGAGAGAVATGAGRASATVVSPGRRGGTGTSRVAIAPVSSGRIGASAGFAATTDGAGVGSGEGSA